MNMVNNMFSVFDPSSSYLSMNWLITLMTIFIYKKSWKKSLTKINLSVKSTMIFISKEVNQLMEKKLKITNSMFLIMFLTLLTMNILAIFPHNFTPTAHISISFSISASMWMSTMIFGWSKQFSSMMAHLTPLGTPNALMNFMVIIEMISTVIRPITLSIRLSANMVAGHLLMSLLSSFSMKSMSYTIMSSTPTALLTLLEMGVAVVQAYVLITLMLLYQNETA